MSTTSTFEILEELKLLDWKVLSIGHHRGWVTPSDLSRFASTCLAVGVSDEDLPAVAALASAEKLSASDVETTLAMLNNQYPSQGDVSVDKWRLARLLKLAGEDLEWDEKVTGLEEISAEFGYPTDMQKCTRYSAGPTDPLDEMTILISDIKTRLGVD